MKLILLIILFHFYFPFILKSQSFDSTIYKDCKILYEKKKYKEAYDCFAQYDTNIHAIYHAATIARYINLRNFKLQSEKLISKKFCSPYSYKLYANLFMYDSSNYIKILKKGLKAFKNDTNLLTQVINYYIAIKKYKKAKSLLDKLIVIKQNKKSLYFARGYAYEHLKDNYHALIDYNKEIEIDSGHFNAFYNIAAIYNNQAVNMYNSANKESMREKYLIQKNKADKMLEKSIPYFIRANEIKTNDLTILEALRKIYYRLKKEKEIKEIIYHIEQINNK